MNAGSEKPTDGLAAWTQHYQQIGQRRPRRATRIRHRRGFSPMRLALLLLAIAVAVVSVGLASI